MQESQDHEEGKEAEQDEKYFPAAAVHGASHDTGINDISREKRSIDQQEHQPYSRVFGKYSEAIGQGAQEQQHDPIEFLHFWRLLSGFVVVVFHAGLNRWLKLPYPILGVKCFRLTGGTVR